MREFKLQELKDAGLEEIMAVDGTGPELAKNIRRLFQ
jgi:ERCC4-type nuclease